MPCFQPPFLSGRGLGQGPGQKGDSAPHHHSGTQADKGSTICHTVASAPTEELEAPTASASPWDKSRLTVHQPELVLWSH